MAFTREGNEHTLKNMNVIRRLIKTGMQQIPNEAYSQEKLRDNPS